MTQKQIRTRAALLYESVSGIRDEYLDEAIRFMSRPAVIRKSGKRTARRWLTAAAVVLVVTLTVVRVAGRLKNNDNPVTPAQSLSADLREAVRGSGFVTCNASDLDLYGGYGYVVVQDIATGTFYRSRALTPSEEKDVRTELNSTGTAVPDSAGYDFRVWIVNGNGTVISPCLDPSVGNIGVGSLFDYEPERVPTDTFRSLIQRLKTS